MPSQDEGFSETCHVWSWRSHCAFAVADYEQHQNVAEILLHWVSLSELFPLILVS